MSMKRKEHHQGTKARRRTRLVFAALRVFLVPWYLGGEESPERSRNIYENKAKWQISPLPWGEGGPARRFYQPRWDG
jgi:hypothetical protein